MTGDVTHTVSYVLVSIGAMLMDALTYNPSIFFIFQLSVITTLYVKAVMSWCYDSEMN